MATSDPSSSAASPSVVFDITRIDRWLYTWHFEFGGVVKIGYGSRGAAIEAAARWIKRHGGGNVD